MQRAVKLRVDVTVDHVIRLPADVPVGPAEVIVLVDPPGAQPGARRPVGIDATAGLTVPDDFDDPLPEEIQKAWEGITHP